MTPARQRPAVSTRDQVIATAVERIQREGMSVSLEHLSLERIIKASGVSRATAYRHWPTKTDFLAEVLVAVVRSTRLEGETEEEVGNLRAFMEAERPALGTEQGRRDLVVEGFRRSVDADFRKVLGSPQWRTYLALGSTCRGLPEGQLRDEVETALAEAERAFTAHRAQVYARLPVLLGYRLVPPLAGDAGFTLMAEATGAMMTGLVVRALARPELVTQTFGMAPYGSSRVAEWTQPQLHMVGVILSHLEPDPHVTWGESYLPTAMAQLEVIAAALEASRAEPSTR